MRTVPDSRTSGPKECSSRFFPGPRSRRGGRNFLASLAGLLVLVEVCTHTAKQVFAGASTPGDPLSRQPLRCCDASFAGQGFLSRSRWRVDSSNGQKFHDASVAAGREDIWAHSPCVQLVMFSAGASMATYLCLFGLVLRVCRVATSL